MCTSTNSGLSDDEVYEIVKAVSESRTTWADCAKSVEKQAALENVLRVRFPSRCIRAQSATLRKSVSPFPTT